MVRIDSKRGETMAKQLQGWLDDFVEQCGFDPNDVENWGKENVKINLVMNGNINPYINTSTFIPKNFYSQMSDYWERFDPQPLSLPNVERVEDKAFNEFTYVQELILPKCKYIGEDAFKEGMWTKVDAPECTYLGRRAFGGNHNGNCAYYFPKLEFIGKEAFNAANTSAELVVIFLEGDKFCTLEEKGSLKLDRAEEVIVYVNKNLYNQYLEDPVWAEAIEQYDNLSVYYIGQEIPAPTPLPLNECTLEYAKKMVRAKNYKDVWNIGDKITLSIPLGWNQSITTTATLIDMEHWNGLDVIFQIDPIYANISGPYNYIRNSILSNLPFLPTDSNSSSFHMYNSITDYPLRDFPELARASLMEGVWSKSCYNYGNWEKYEYDVYYFTPSKVMKRFFIPSVKQLTGQNIADNDIALTDHKQFAYYKNLNLSNLLVEDSTTILTSSYMKNSQSEYEGVAYNAFYNPITSDIELGPVYGSKDPQKFTYICCFGFSEGV